VLTVVTGFQALLAGEQDVAASVRASPSASPFVDTALIASLQEPESLQFQGVQIQVMHDDC
jgi:hypothetical protein